VDARNKLDTQADTNAEANSTIVTTRVFDAPRELVFAAWTDPRHLVQWWGPDGFTTTTRSIDVRVGGVWRFVMHGPDGRDYENRITYHEIVPPRRLVYSHDGGEDADVEPVAFRTTVTFEDIGGKTRLMMQALFPTAAARDRVATEYGAIEGAQQHLARLAAHLVTMR